MRKVTYTDLVIAVAVIAAGIIVVVKTSDAAAVGNYWIVIAALLGVMLFFELVEGKARKALRRHARVLDNPVENEVGGVIINGAAVIGIVAVALILFAMIDVKGTPLYDAAVCLWICAGIVSARVLARKLRIGRLLAYAAAALGVLVAAVASLPLAGIS